MCLIFIKKRVIIELMKKKPIDIWSSVFESNDKRLFAVCCIQPNEGSKFKAKTKPEKHWHIPKPRYEKKIKQTPIRKQILKKKQIAHLKMERDPTQLALTFGPLIALRDTA